MIETDRKTEGVCLMAPEAGASKYLGEWNAYWHPFWTFQMRFMDTVFLCYYENSYYY